MTAIGIKDLIRKFEATDEIMLRPVGSWPATHHKFDPESRWAIISALAARRPLLIRGEPGIGKSQLARAAAEVMNAPLLSYVINARTESDELLFKYDAVSRLARAQLMGTQKYGGDPEVDLAERNYVRPACLWWAFHWQTAAKQARVCYGGCTTPEHPEGWDPMRTGCVVLIDEIDKADTDVPNSLLESLGNTGFEVPYLGETVALPEGAPAPLVVLTTNEERELPAAFLRRCLVYQMALPTDEDELIDFVITRARVHFDEGVIAEETYVAAAKLLVTDRELARNTGLSIPGFAEYRDLLTALAAICPKNAEEQNAKLTLISKFALKKNAEGV